MVISPWSSKQRDRMLDQADRRLDLHERETANMEVAVRELAEIKLRLRAQELRLTKLEATQGAPD